MKLLMKAWTFLEIMVLKENAYLGLPMPKKLKKNLFRMNKILLSYWKSLLARF